MIGNSVENYSWKLNLGLIQRKLPNAKTILARAVVLRIGWEMDNEVCAVEMNDGERVLIGTSHGDIHKIDPEELREDMANYKVALAQSKEVMAAVGQGRIAAT